jgi:hypothetical protein
VNEKSKGLNTKSVQVQNVGDLDRVPYQDIDVVKACRVNEKVALSFYQIDFQAFVNAIQKESSPSADYFLPVSKVVMNFESFHMLRNELNNLATKLESKESKEKEDVSEQD